MAGLPLVRIGRNDSYQSNEKSGDLPNDLGDPYGTPDRRMDREILSIVVGGNPWTETEEIERLKIFPM